MQERRCTRGNQDLAAMTSMQFMCFDVLSVYACDEDVTPCQGKSHYENAHQLAISIWSGVELAQTL